MKSLDNNHPYTYTIIFLECKTIAGQDPYKPCVFPFIYEDVSYDECTRANFDQLWCATEVDSDGEWTKWGNCDMAPDTCPPGSNYFHR